MEQKKPKQYLGICSRGYYSHQAIIFVVGDKDDGAFVPSGHNKGLSTVTNAAQIGPKIRAKIGDTA